MLALVWLGYPGVCDLQVHNVKRRYEVHRAYTRHDAHSPMYRVSVCMQVHNMKRRYEVGLEKLLAAEADVNTMKAELIELQPKLVETGTCVCMLGSGKAGHTHTHTRAQISLHTRYPS